MPLEENLVLYGLINAFHHLLKIKISNESKKFLDKELAQFINLDPAEKIYYAEYAMRLAAELAKYLGEIRKLELNVDDDAEVIHDLRLYSGETTYYVSISHRSINIRNIIPEKLMKICQYKKSTNISRAFHSEYEDINNSGYEKVHSYEKYSQVPDHLKNKAIYKPLCNMIMNLLSKKRKCAENLFNYLFQEPNRIVLKLHRNRFVIYDFGTPLDKVKSFKMKLISSNEISITFNNHCEFLLTLHTNGKKIKKRLSLKFHTQFTNLDEIFSVATRKV